MSLHLTRHQHCQEELKMVQARWGCNCHHRCLPPSGRLACWRLQLFLLSPLKVCWVRRFNVCCHETYISVTTIIRAQGNKDLGGSYSGTGSNHHRSVKQCKQWAECRIWFETTEKTLYKSRRIRPRVTQRLGNKNAYNQSHTHRNMYKTKRMRPRVMQRQVFTVLIHWTAIALAAEDKLCKPRHCCICVGCKLQSYASHIFSFLFICFLMCVVSLFVGLQLLLIVVMS